MRRLSKVLLLSFILIIGLSLVVCGASDSVWYPDPDADWVKNTDEITVFNLGTMEYDPAIKEIGIAFERLTGIHVNFYEASTGTLVEEMNRSLALGESTFDVLDPTLAWALPDFVNAGWIVPLDDVIPERIQEQWTPAFQKSTKMNGKLWAAPHQAETFTLFYRKDLVEKAVKETGIDFPCESWDEFIKLAEALTVDKDGDGSIDRYGFAYAVGTGEFAFQNYSSFVYAAGGKMFNKDGSPAFNSPEGKAALKYMVDLVNKYKVSPQAVVNFEEGNLKDMMAGDNVAMVIVDNSMYAAFKGLEKYGSQIGMEKVVPRSPDTEEHYFVKGLTYVVNKNSEHVEAAKQYVALASSYFGNWLEGSVELNAPANTTVYDSPYFRGRYPNPDIIKESFEKGRRASIPERSLVQDIVRQGVQEAIRGNKTVEEAIDWIIDEFENEGL